MGLLIKIVLIVFLVLYIIGKFMQGYNMLDTPSQVRKIAKNQQASNGSDRLQELEREKEILELKKEIEELKLK